MIQTNPLNMQKINLKNLFLVKKIFKMQKFNETNGIINK